MIPLAAPNISGNEGKYLQECVRTTFVSSVGEFVQRFEEMLAERHQAPSGLPFGIATSCGTSALHVSLIDAGVNAGDLVISASFSFIATANSIRYCGAIPWLIDIDTASWNLSPEKLDAEIAQNCELREDGLFHVKSGRRVAAVLPVHAAGLPADMKSIQKICQKYNLPLIADAAAAMGAYFTYDGQKEPLGFYSDLSCFSFNGNKIVTCGGGGGIITHDEKRAKHIKHLSTTARLTPDYIHDEVGYNYRMTNLEAAVGCAQMERLEEFMARKKEIALRYKRFVTKYSDILENFPSVSYAQGNYWFSGIVFKDTLGTKEGIEKIMENVRKDAKAKSIDIRPFWVPIHLQPPHADSLYSSLEITEGTYYRVMPLPCSTNLTEDELNLVLETLEASLQRNVL